MINSRFIWHFQVVLSYLKAGNQIGEETEIVHAKFVIGADGQQALDTVITI